LSGNRTKARSCARTVASMDPAPCCNRRKRRFPRS
jgi:hypothetical protein